MLNRWQRTIVDLRGNVVPYAQLQILREQTQSAPTIYRDKAGTEVIPNAIVTANQNGYAYFYAPADLYRIRSTQPSIDWRDVDVGSAAAQQLAQQALDNAVPTYETLVDMQADTGQPVPTLGRVVNDSTLENNGYYVWTGTAWERAAYQPLGDMDVSIEPAPSKIPRATGDGVIREAWVEDLLFNYDQIYAQLWSARYPGIPAPSFYQEFGGGASLLDPRITFSRSGEATYIKNGRLLTAGVDEPVFENGGLRMWRSVNNEYIFSADILGGVPSNIPLYYNVSEAQSSLWGMDNRPAILEKTSSNTPNWNLLGEHSTRFNGGTVSCRLLVEIFVNQSAPSNFALRDRQEGLIVDQEIFRFNETTKIGAGPNGGDLHEKTWTVEVPDNDHEHNLLWYPVSGSEGELIVHMIQANGGSLAKNPIILTNGQPETMPADNAVIEGAAFSSIFNPNQGALVLPHSSFGEGNIITLGGLQVTRTEDGLELNNTAIPDTEDAKQNLKLRWGSNGLDVFVGNTKAVHDIPIPANWGDADSLVLADNDSAGKYIDRLAMLTEAPTDSNMEGM